MAVNLPPVPSPNEDISGPVWQKWFQALRASITTAGGVLWSSIDFTGSNITSIVTRRHNDLQAIQGGAANDYQHLTTDEYNRMRSNQVLTWLSM